MLAPDGGGPAAGRSRSPSAHGSSGGGDRPACRAERAAARHRVRAGVAVHRRPGAADAADTPPPARRRARRSDVPRPRAPAPGGHPGLSRRADRGGGPPRRRPVRLRRARSSRGPSTTVELLRELAAAIAGELERGSLAAELEDSTVRLDARVRGGEHRQLRLGPASRTRCTGTTGSMELFGYTAETFTPHIDSFTVRLHPADLPRTEAAIAKAIDTLRRLRGRLPRGPRRRDGPLGRGPRAGAVRRVGRRGRGCSAPPTTRRLSTAPPSASAACWRR